MDGSLPDLRRQVAGLLAGTIDLNQFQHWFIMNETAIEQLGTDADVDYLNCVENLLAELTGDHISGTQFIEALRERNEEYVSEPDLASVGQA